MDDSDKLKKIKEQDKLRQAKYYASKKALINERRRLKYQERKLEKTENSIQEPYQPTIQEQVQPTIQEPTPTADNPNQRFLNNLLKKQLTEHTKKRYLGDMKRIFSLVEKNDIVDLVKQGKMKDVLENSKYATATKRGMMILILQGIRDMKIKVGKKIIQKLEVYIEVLKQQESDANKAKTETEEVLTFNEYLRKINDEYGENSKMFLIGKMYEELTLRDDFQLLIVSKTTRDTNHNYLILNKEKIRITINKYKTEKRYGVISVLLSKKLSNLVKRYIQENKLNVGDYLFGDKELSDYINYNNKKVAVNGSISLFRKMKITELYNDPKVRKEEKIELASKMAHSPLIQLTYLRQMKISE